MIEAKQATRHPRNAPGRYYVCDGCDGCAYCAAVAPDLFEFEKVTNTYFVGQQPRTPEEEEWMIEAMDDCPVDAIRANGAGSDR
jgi:ferredoxin